MAESLGPDGEDPLDVLVAVSEPTFPGCGVLAKPVAVLELREEGHVEPKVLCVPCEDPNWQGVDALDDLPEQLVEEIAHLFVAYKKRAGHEVEVTGWSSREDAAKVIDEARERVHDAGS